MRGIEKRLDELKVDIPRDVVPPGTKLPPVPVTYHVELGEWVLLDHYKYEDPSTGVTLLVKKGFPFDLSSVPRVAWPLIAPFELSIVAPLFHDVLYRHGGVPGKFLVFDDPEYEYSRKESDVLFRRHMRLEGVRRLRRKPAYYVVRSLGFRRFREPGTYYDEAA